MGPQVPLFTSISGTTVNPAPRAVPADWLGRSTRCSRAELAGGSPLHWRSIAVRGKIAKNRVIAATVPARASERKACGAHLLGLLGGKLSSPKSVHFVHMSRRTSYPSMSRRLAKVSVLAVSALSLFACSAHVQPAWSASPTVAQQVCSRPVALEPRRGNPRHQPRPKPTFVASPTSRVARVSASPRVRSILPDVSGSARAESDPGARSARDLPSSRRGARGTSRPKSTRRHSRARGARDANPGAASKTDAARGKTAAHEREKRQSHRNIDR